jgi:hypothetical protein
VLANEDRQQIAAYVGTTPEVVETYEMLFFDVREMLSYPGYIKMVVLGGATTGEVNRTDPDIFWKMLGYIGKDCLYQWWELGKVDENWIDFWRQAGRSQAAKNYYAAEVGREVNKYTQRFVVEQAIMQKKIEIDAHVAGVGDKVQDSTSDLLPSLGFTIASVVDLFLPSAEEPRADDMIRAQLEAVKMDPEAPQLPGPDQEQPK